MVAFHNFLFTDSLFNKHNKRAVGIHLKETITYGIITNDTVET